MSTEMGISCQRNGHWAATNHLSGRGLVQPIKELSSAAGWCAGRSSALIRQLANRVLIDPRLLLMNSDHKPNARLVCLVC